MFFFFKERRTYSVQYLRGKKKNEKKMTRLSHES